PERPALSSPRASRATTRSRSRLPSDPWAGRSGWTSSVPPACGPSMTVASATGRSSRSAVRRSSNKDTRDLPVDRFEEEVDRAAAREAGGERFVVAVAERGDVRLAPVEQGERLGHDGALDAAARHRADHLSEV